jgi:hypothetical protein
LYREAVPTIATRLAGPGHSVEAPSFRSSRHIQRHDEITATRGEAVDADDHLAGSDQR